MHQSNAAEQQKLEASAERVSKALERLPFGRGQKQLAAEVFVSHLIDNLPLHSHERRAVLPGSLPSLLNTFQLLSVIPHEARYHFFSQVIDRALSPGNRKEVPFLAAVLTQAGYWLDGSERLNLLLDISNRRATGSSAKCWIALVRSAKTIEEAHRRLHGSGRDKLFAFASRELREFIVTVEVVSSLRAIVLPNKPSPYATNPEYLSECAKQLKSGLDRAHKVLHDMQWAHGTSRYGRFKGLLKVSAQLLASQLEGAATPGARNRVLRAHITRIGLEFEYGKSFTEDAQRPWTEKELNVVNRSLTDTGSYRNICSSVLRIHRSAGLEDASGTISTCGTVIELEDRCFAEGKEAVVVREGCTPEEIVDHEFGHSLSMVPIDTVLKKIDAIRRKAGGGVELSLNELFVADHFPEIFLRLGRWGGMFTGFEVDDAGVVHVNGEKIRTNEPVQVKGEYRVYRYNEHYQCLYWYDFGRGEIPRRAVWSQADPTEYFTEGFSDYYGAPQELIEYAPKLFWYFESLYHRYDKDQNMFERLRERLKTRVAPEPLHIPAPVDAFSLLQSSEQLSILEKAGLAPRRWDRESPRRDDREKVFLRACTQGIKQRAVTKLLHENLSQYNPALLLARSTLFSGGHVAVASIRGSCSSERDTQERLRGEVADVLGSQFDKRDIFLLSDVKRSARFRSQSYHEKLVSLITMHLSGYEPRPDGQHKRLEKSYEKVVLYTDIFPTSKYVNDFARKQKITDKISIFSPEEIDPVEAARNYLKAHPAPEPNEQHILHLFILEDLVHLPAKFYVRLNGGRVIRPLSLKEFLLHPDPDYWRSVVAAQRKIYAKRDLVFDDSEFTAEAPLVSLLSDGRDGAAMLKQRPRGRLN